MKIIHRIWGNEDQPSSSMALISALHTELERARLLVNQHIHDQRSKQNEMAYLMKCFAEEKAAWKSKERKVVEAAIESVAGELEVERKLRRRLESLNKKLGKELAETKMSLIKAVKDLESEKRMREIMEQVCDDLARNSNEDRVEADELKWESAKVHEENEKEREMMQFSDFWQEERAQEKLSKAKYETEEKTADVDMFSQLEVFMGDAALVHLSTYVPAIKENLEESGKKNEELELTHKKLQEQINETEELHKQSGKHAKSELSAVQEKLVVSKSQGVRHHVKEGVGTCGKSRSRSSYI